MITVEPSGNSALYGPFVFPMRSPRVLATILTKRPFGCSLAKNDILPRVPRARGSDGESIGDCSVRRPHSRRTNSGPSRSSIDGFYGNHRAAFDFLREAGLKIREVSLAASAGMLFT